MGFLAPICAEGQEFEVRRMDLQFWALTGWFGLANEYFLDVGLLIRPAQHDVVREFSLAVPFGVATTEVRDLSEEIGSKAGVLIGPGTVVSNNATEVSFTRPTTVESPFTKVSISATDYSEYSQSGVAVCTFQLNKPATAQEGAYVRMRLPMERPFRCVTRKRSGLGQNGALIDLRVSDTHEVDDDAEFRDYRERIADIHWLQLSVVIRAALQLRAASPDPFRLRLLERGIWEGYVNRKLAPRRSGAIVSLIAYEFDSTSGFKNSGTICRDNPFNVFMDVSREFGLLPFGNFLRMAMLVAIASSVGAAISLDDLGVFGAVLGSVRLFVSDFFLGILGIMGASSVLVYIQRIRRGIRIAARRIKQVGRRV